ncbi:MAG TPA: hypothetical protein VHJ78_06700 [Actinomycetota bacterium]|nr:hypothetical protein [Actinomycetota bacterium]
MTEQEEELQPGSTDSEVGTTGRSAYSGGEGPGAGYVSAFSITVGGVITVLLAALSLYTLWAFWPTPSGQGITAPDPAPDASPTSVGPTDEGPAGEPIQGEESPSRQAESAGANETPNGEQQVSYFGWTWTLSRETLFFVVVAAGGVIGGIIHAIRSLGWYVGNRDLRWSWVFFNAMLPVVGALGATVFYLVLRAGLFSPSTSVEQASPFGFAAVAVLVGVFTEEAFEKLRELAENVFTKRAKGADHVPPKQQPKQTTPEGEVPPG